MTDSGIANPPSLPPTLPATTYPGDSGHTGTVKVTRNVPPKRVMVATNNTVTYGGKAYTEGESFVHGEGPAADQLALMGHVIIVDHDATEDWNGAEGDAVRKDALAALDAEHASAGTARAHDHGFVKYEHADGDGAIPVDLTAHRQQLAQKHMIEGRAGTDEDFGKKKGGTK